MAIDWDAIDKAIGQAKQETDDSLASKISSLTRLTDDEIKSLFPTPADVQKLADLMKIVKGTTDRNRKINGLVSNIGSLAGTVVTLLEKFA